MVFYIFIQMTIDYSVANSGDTDQMPRSVASDLGLHCLPMSQSDKKDARLIWDNLLSSVLEQLYRILLRVPIVMGDLLLQSLKFSSVSTLIKISLID